MSLKIMIAGCAKEEKDAVGSSVKKAFADRPKDEPWRVSVVKIANQWSVEIDGPEARFKGLSLSAPLGDLTGALRNAIANAGNHVTKPVKMAPGKEKVERYDCEGCSAPFEVVYHAAPGEREEVCPVACPHCWHVNHVPIAEGAGVTGDYRAQAVS
ncbi:MAG TPA: hypothetical protein VIG29_02170 [Vicinamibacteria bacterium]|jgi:hypothetical protein